MENSSKNTKENSVYLNSVQEKQRLERAKEHIEIVDNVIGKMLATHEKKMEERQFTREEYGILKSQLDRKKIAIRKDCANCGQEFIEMHGITFKIFVDLRIDKNFVQKGPICILCTYAHHSNWYNGQSQDEILENITGLKLGEIFKPSEKGLEFGEDPPLKIFKSKEDADQAVKERIKKKPFILGPHYTKEQVKEAFGPDYTCHEELEEFRKRGITPKPELQSDREMPELVLNQIDSPEYQACLAQLALSMPTMAKKLGYKGSTTELREKEQGKRAYRDLHPDPFAPSRHGEMPTNPNNEGNSTPKNEITGD